MGIIKTAKDNNELGARKQLIEELFNDFYSSRRKIYFMNFFRGVFFGFGVLVGGTILVAIIIWVLNQFTSIFPAIGDFIDGFTELIRNR